MAESRYEKSLRETKSLRSRVPAKLRPLFDHVVNLAKDSHAHGYYKRAGRELRHARKAVTVFCLGDELATKKRR